MTNSGGEVGARRVRARPVVGVIPMAHLMIEPRWLVGVRVHLVELFIVCAVLGALDMGDFDGSTNRVSNCFC